MITFTPLSGAARSVRTSPLCYLLQVDDVRILLDCGSPDWCPEQLESDQHGEPVYEWEDYCHALRDLSPTIDLVLLSHGDLSHTGLFPYAYSRWSLKAPTYTTLPVQAMARMAATEDVDGIREEQDIGDEWEQQPEADDRAMQIDVNEAEPVIQTVKTKGRYIATAREVHDAFDSVNTLRYSQPTHLQGKCQGLTITPFNAGHTLGGTIWKIRSPSSGTIIYAVNVNHMRERHLDGTVLTRSTGGIFEPLARPDLLITDAERVTAITSRRKDRDAALIDTVTATLSSRNSLLLPCDSSTRVLELLVLLDQHWNYSRLRYPICFLSRTASEMLTFVRSMMEWLGGTISKEDVGEEGNNRHESRRRKGDDDADDDALGALALRFRHLEFFPTPQALIHKYSSKDPKLILAVPASLSHGPSRHLFCDFASMSDNVILLTGRGEYGTLGRTLFDKWNSRQRGDDKWDKGRIGSNIMLDGSIKLTMHAKVPLQGQELESYLQKERESKEAEAARLAAAARSRPMLEADQDDSDSDDSEDEDDEMDPENREKDADWNIDADEGLTKLLSFDIYLKGNVSKATSFFKNASGQSQRFRMFPYVERKRRVDEYGETIDVGTWLRKGKALEETESEENQKNNKKRQIEIDDKPSVEELPSKFVTSEVEVQLACRLLFVDMEGLNDGRAVKTILPQVSPRKMIIVHASDEGTRTLVDSCANIRAMTRDIYSPVAGEKVQIGQQINSFAISISDELLSSLKMARFEDNEVGFVTGRVVTHAGSIIPTLEPVSSSMLSIDSQGQADVSKPRILGSRASIALPNSTMIGELKLTVLKARLTSVGVHAELVGEGVLICESPPNGEGGTKDSVAVRKSAGGKVELEGSVSPVYYTVRKEIYNLHALVTT